MRRGTAVMDTCDKKRCSFEDYVQMDPRIGELLKEAQTVKKVEGKSFCANHIWYGGLKSKVCEFVGFDRTSGPRELQTSAAYDAVYEKTYSALPDCDHGDDWCF
jgi:hypothetical protein